MISKEEVTHIAKLARLELTESEIEKMQKDLSSILNYFNLLKKAKTPKSVAGTAKGPNATREDKPIEQRSTLAGDLIAAAPDKKDDYIKVKTIL